MPKGYPKIQQPKVAQEPNLNNMPVEDKSVDKSVERLIGKLAEHKNEDFWTTLSIKTIGEMTLMTEVAIANQNTLQRDTVIYKDSVSVTTLVQENVHPGILPDESVPGKKSEKIVFTLPGTAIPGGRRIS